MALTMTMKRHGVPLDSIQEQRVQHHLTALERRLLHRPDPIAVLSFSACDRHHEVVASLRLQLGPLGPTLTSEQTSQTPDRAAHLAIQAVERQLERLLAGQRGEPSYGVPSRRRMGSPAAGAEAIPQEAAPATDGA